MPLENLSWIVPAGAQAWDNRKHIVTIWDRIVAALRGKKSRIAFTGVSGTGKTVLFDCLTGDGFKPHYSPPKFGSAQEEQGSLAAKKKRIGLVVVPGDTASTRFEVMEDLFDPESTVDGVVHVVANGFVEVRGLDARNALVTEGGLDTTQKSREHQLGAEGFS